MSEVFIPPGLMENEYHEAFAERMMPNPLDAQFGSFSGAMTPKDRKLRIKKAKEYCDVDIIDRILRIKVDFGFRLKKIKCDSVAQQNFYDTYVTPLLKRVIPQYIHERNSLGDVIFHYADYPNSSTPMFLILEDPENITIQNALGVEQYEIQLSNTFKENIKKLMDRNQLGQLPEYLQKAIKPSKNGMPADRLYLTSENMKRIDWYKKDYKQYSDVPLMKIAPALQLRDALYDTDLTATYGLKKGILHFKVGNDKDTTNKSKAPEKIEALKKLVTSQPPGAFMLFTSSDVNLEFHYPKPEIWSAQKYEASDKRILEWSGISTTIISGEGSAYSTAIVSLAGLKQQLKADQEKFEEFLEFFCGMVNKKKGFRKMPKFIFERPSLEDNKEFMERLRFLVGMGYYGIQDALEEFDLDYDEQLEKKKKDQKVAEYFRPHFEEKQGLLNPDIKTSGSSGEPKGRPKTNNTNIRNTNQPRPSS